MCIQEKGLGKEWYEGLKEGERERGKKNELLKWLWLKSQGTFPPSAIGGNFESPFTLVAAAATVAAVAAVAAVAVVSRIQNF